MKTSLRTKLESLVKRRNELDQLLASPDVISNQEQFRILAKEHAELSPVVVCFWRYREIEHTLAGAEELMHEDDPELRALASDEATASREQIAELELELQRLLVPKDPNDDSNIFLEIRAGTGGNEAALFAGDLVRMYFRYAELHSWEIEIMSSSDAEVGGHKEVIAKVIGKGAYSRLKFESGAHRVQRVPETESQGRIHTSACTVAVLPEVDEISDIEISANDLRIDTYRASGAGGQHVNKTDSAIRITHLPTNVVVECQDERSQHKNRARAMSLLKAKLLQAERARQIADQASTRRDLVGSGDRSERIRTYNFPQGRITDHRINLTVYKLEEVLTGQLDHIINPLISEHQADLMSQLPQG